MNFIDINKDLIPYQFDMTLANETYTFGVFYNVENDFFTLDLFKNNIQVVAGEKLVYERPLFLTSQHKDIPKVDIIPYDLTSKTERITYENFNEQVFLFLVGD